MIFKKQKRGMILVLTLGLLFGFLIMPLLFIRLESKKFRFERKLGDIQSDAIDLYQGADKILFYIDESARYSSHQAIYELGLKGGHSGPCRQHQGYSLWVSDNGDCYPEPKRNLPVFVQRYLSEYLAAYPNITLPNNYDFFVNQDEKLEIIGISPTNLDFDKTIDVYSMDYSVKPSFRATIDYDLNDYELLKQASREMIAYVNTCRENKGLSLCVPEARSEANRRLTQNNLQLVDVSECGGSALGDTQTRIYGFCAESNKKVIAYNSRQARTDFWHVVIKFAIQFPKKSI